MISGATTERARRTRATVALFLVSVVWGFTFLWMKQSVEALERVGGPGRGLAGSALFLALRFALAAALLALCVPSSRRGLLSRARARRAEGADVRATGGASASAAAPAIAIDVAGSAAIAVEAVEPAGAWRGGAWLAALLVVGFLLQMVGLADLTPAVSAFLTSLYVLFLAVITAVVERRLPRAGFLVGALLATAGAAVVRGRPEIAEWRAAELLTVGASIAFAVHILATDRVTKRAPAMPVTLAMFVCVALGGAALFAIETLRGNGFTVVQIGALCRDPEFLSPLALTTVFGTVLALAAMNLYQRDVDPVRAAILYALEPIWAALIGVYAGEDSWSLWLVLGGGLLLAGNLIAELAGRATTIPTSPKSAG